MFDWNQLPLLAEREVVVAGGGPAGVAAALHAARLGKQVLLLEKGGCCGGLGTAGLVPMIYVGYREDQSFLNATCREVVERYCAEAGVARDYPWQTTDPEIMRRLYDDLLAAAGVQTLFHMTVAAVQRTGGRLQSLIVATGNGLRRVAGQCFIDATGDGLVAMESGATSDLGDENGHTMSPTLCVQYGNVRHPELLAAEAGEENPRQLFLRLLAEGRAPVADWHFVGIRPYGHAAAGGNLGHIYGVNAMEELALSQAYVEGRKLAVVYRDFYRRHVPGCEAIDLMATASLLGVRETRRIHCDYQMSMADYCRRADFEDEIGRFSYPVDIHASRNHAGEQKQVEERIRQTAYTPGESYGVSFRALLPIGLDNLLVAGRCIGCDRAVQSSIRVMSGAFLTGQGAGVGAALALRYGGTRAIPAAELRRAIPS